MKGEGFCRESPDDGGNDEHPHHCIHRRLRAGDFICCFCGDLFIDEESKPQCTHGRYQPRREKL